MMFRVSLGREVLNPYEWLPAYGESGVNFYSDGSDVILEIGYESDEGEEKLKREIRFNGVCAFYKSAFPGASGLINISYEGKWPIGSLIEFEQSDVASAWSEHYPGRSNIKHYLMQFTSENIQFHIVATGYVLGGEKQV